MAKTEPSINEKKSRFNWPRIFGYDFFISFKLGHPPIGTQSYASDLARRLREQDFTVFFSEDEMPPGAKLEAGLVKVIHRSRILLVVANEGALVHSQWVRKEVEEFRRKHPKRQIISINVDRAIETFGTQVAASQWLDHEDRAWLNETNDAINEGITSPEVLTRLLLAPQFTKANTWFWRMVIAIIFILIGLTSWAGYEAFDANHKFRDATALRLAAEGSATTAATRSGTQIQGLLKVLAGHRISRSANSDEALQTEYLKFHSMVMVRKSTGELSDVIISPDGSNLTSLSIKGDLKVWDIKSGKLIKQSKIHLGNRGCLAMSSDGNRIVTGDMNETSESDDETLSILDINTDKTVGKPFTLTGFNHHTMSASFSPDGKRVVTGNQNGSLYLWDIETGKGIGEPLHGHTAPILSVDFSPNGDRIVSASYDKTVRVWDAITGQNIGSVFKHDDRLFRVVFSPNGKYVVSGSLDSTLRIWDIETGKQKGQPIRGHGEMITSVAFSPDGKIVASGSEDKTLRLWNTETGQPIGQPLKGYEARISSITFSVDGKRIVSGGWDGSIRIWFVDDSQLIDQPFEANGYDSLNVAFRSNGKQIVTLNQGNEILIWDANTKEHIGQPLKDSKFLISAFTVSPNGKFFVTSGSDENASDQILRLWNAETGQSIGGPFKGHKNQIESLAFSPDGKRIVSGSQDNTLRIWNVDTGQPIGEPLKGHEDSINSIAFSPDGKRLVSGSSDKTLRLWDANTGHPINQPLKGHEEKITSVAYSPDGKLIVSASSDRTLRLWDAASGQSIGLPLSGDNEGSIFSVAFSPDGKRIVSGGWDAALHLWDATNGQPLGSALKGHKTIVRSVAFSPDGKLIVSGSQDETVRLWDVFEGWADALCFKVGRNMSHQEWRDWVSPDINYIEQCPGWPMPSDESELSTSAETALISP
jgi:WD40 repeat protein